ncbi:unnamed protein product [Moneuplotes crassus]|uniref:C2H2-type domain-containing protein n=2 Tax=Euplotes crassus TaxID=5936 RepID=A0AAD1XYL4_EUPCR|nr:unnamed protein product [Moneuplotes crassus]
MDSQGKEKGIKALNDVVLAHDEAALAVMQADSCLLYQKQYYATILLAQRIKEEMLQKFELEKMIEKMNSEKKRYESMAIPGILVPTDKHGKHLVRVMAKPKRHRRTKSEIQRKYKCRSGHCSKSYGSEGSLNQHIKLKHPEYWNEIINSGKVRKL